MTAEFYQPNLIPLEPKSRAKMIGSRNLSMAVSSDRGLSP